MAMVSHSFEQVNLLDFKQDNEQVEQKVEEEEEEEEYDDEEDMYYIQENSIPYMDEQVNFDLDNSNNFIQATSQEEESNDDSFYLANRTFYTTCHKISRQNSPSYRKRPPYTFLENWFIHSVFSKSQQILLRFPVIHPKVMMTEGDFIYTPHQMANNNQQSDMYYNNDQQEDEDYDYYDDAFVIGDEGVMVMSASAPDASQFMAADEDDDQETPSLIMDENMWMGHSRYNSNGLTLHVVNPDHDDDNEEEDPMYHHNPYKSIISHNNYQGQQLQMVQEEDEEEEEEEEEDDEEEALATIKEELKSKLSMSPEVLNWYRSADTRPVLALTSSTEENQQNCGSSTTSSNSSSSSTCSNESCSQPTDIRSVTDEVEKTVTRHSSESYQSLADIIQEEQLRDYGTLPTHHNRSIVTTTKKTFPLMQVSACFVDAAWVAMDMAQTYTENSNGNKNVTGFITCLFRIWKVLFLGAETMLGWGNHRLKPQAMV